MDEKLTVARLRALADPVRLRLVRLLAELPDERTLHDPRCDGTLGVCFCHLVEQLELSAPTVSHHLKILREAGLIEVVRAGRWSYYRLLPAGIEGLFLELQSLRTVHQIRRLGHAL